MQRRTMTIGATLGAIAAIAIPSSVVLASTATPAQPDLALMQSHGGSEVPLPKIVLDGDHGFDLESVRYVEDSAEGSGWIAMNAEEKLCFIVAIGEEAAAASCTEPHNFNERGTAVQVATPDEAVEKYLLPDSFGGDTVVSVDPFASSNDKRAALASQVARSANAASTISEVIVLPAPRAGENSD